MMLGEIQEMLCSMDRLGLDTASAIGLADDGRLAIAVAAGAAAVKVPFRQMSDDSCLVPIRRLCDTHES